MSKIYGILERESRTVTLGDSNRLECGILVGSAKDSEEFVKVWVGKDKKCFKAQMNIYCNKRGFDLFAYTDDDIVIVKSMVGELKYWLEECDYNEMFILLEDLKELEVTLSTYLEDIYRTEE